MTNDEPEDGLTSIDIVGLTSVHECIVLFSVGIAAPDDAYLEPVEQAW